MHQKHIKSTLKHKEEHSQSIRKTGLSLDDSTKSTEQKRGKPIVLIGDGAMSAGIALEALDDIGYSKYPMVIILNDNEMSISRPIGAISKYLSSLTAGTTYLNIKDKVKKLLNYMPDSASYMAKRFEESFKLITPGIFFEELGINYIGPINGHDIGDLVNILKKVKNNPEPVLIHAQTIKGYGYNIAEGKGSKHEKWHSVGPFDIKTGNSLSPSLNIPSPTKVFSNHLLELSNNDPKVVGVTAAMPSGTGLDKLMDAFPDRFFDVAIAEPHAVTSMCSMAKEGFIPFVAIYSTFLQRAFDSLIHDVSILNIPLRFAIDRAGIVGEDGETHQGIFDISYLSLIPNFVLFAPRDNASLKSAIDFAHKYSGSPCAFRYPRGSFILDQANAGFNNNDFIFSKGEILTRGTQRIAFLAYGNAVGKAYLVNEELGGIATLVDLRFAKPLDEELIISLIKEHDIFYIFSDGVKIGGLAQRIALLLAENNLYIKIHSFEFNDAHIKHGSIKDIEKHLNLDVLSLVSIIKNHIKLNQCV